MEVKPIFGGRNVHSFGGRPAPVELTELRFWLWRLLPGPRGASAIFAQPLAQFPSRGHQ